MIFIPPSIIGKILRPVWTWPFFTSFKNFY